jgi:hypothetical protein
MDSFNREVFSVRLPCLHALVFALLLVTYDLNNKMLA